MVEKIKNEIVGLENHQRIIAGAKEKKEAEFMEKVQ